MECRYRALTAQTRTWREARQADSPAAKRAAINNRAAVRKMQFKSSAEHVEMALGWRTRDAELRFKQ